jgi:ADP-ribose pyrophosphatase YjhB (NUDIX family)/predicted kinase
MTPLIVVTALLADHGRALLAKRPDGSWELPTTSLGASESIEEALARGLRGLIGVSCEADEFLNTIYEGGAADVPVIRNVFLVRSWSGTPCLAAGAAYQELRWLGISELAGVETTETQRAILREGLAEEAVLPGAAVTIVTGPAASGKTTVASRLCRRLERAAHIEVDLLRDMVIAGYASPIPADAGDPVAAAEQTRLAADNAVALARNFSLAGYEVAIDAVLETPAAVNEILDGLKGIASVSLITLMPDEVTLQSRDAIRDPDLRQGERCLELRTIYETNGEQRGLRLDSSHMSVSDTVSWILANRDRARVL